MTNSANKKFRSRNSGMTLIEMMVALAIFALTATGLTVSQLRTYELAAQARNATELVAICRSAADVFLVADTSHKILEETGANIFKSEAEAFPFADVDPVSPGVQVAILTGESGESIGSATISRSVIRLSSATSDSNFVVGAQFTAEMQFRGRPLVRSIAINRSVNL